MQSSLEGMVRSKNQDINELRIKLATSEKDRWHVEGAVEDLERTKKQQQHSISTLTETIKSFKESQLAQEEAIKRMEVEKENRLTRTKKVESRSVDAKEHGRSQSMIQVKSGSKSVLKVKSSDKEMEIQLKQYKGRLE